MSLFRHFQVDATIHSPSNAYLCAILSYLIYDEGVMSLTEQDFRTRFNAQIRNLSRDNPFEIKHYEGSKVQGFDYDTQCVLLHHDKLAIVIFRGTEGVPIPFVNQNFLSSARDWMTNAQFDFFQPSYNWTGAVHEGFYRALDTIFGPLFRDLKAIKATHPSLRLFFTGHSLGGALTTLCAYRLEVSQVGLDVSGVYTFGAPRVGNTIFAAGYDETPCYSGTLGTCTWRWVRDKDFAAQLPISLSFGDYFNTDPAETWVHVGQLNYIDESGQVIYDRENPNEGPSVTSLSVSDHDMRAYCRLLFRQLSDEPSETDTGELCQQDIWGNISFW